MAKSSVRRPRANVALQSQFGRIVLVLDPGLSAVPVRLLWAVMDATTIDSASETLRVREGTPANRIAQDIDAWTRGDGAPEFFAKIPQWAESRGVEGVVWTALPPRFNGEVGAGPAVEDVVRFPARLTGPVHDDAEQYIHRAPRQFDAPYRRTVEAALYWTPLFTGLDPCDAGCSLRTNGSSHILRMFSSLLRTYKFRRRYFPRTPRWLR